MSIRTWRSSKRFAAAVAGAAVGASLLALPASPAGAITPDSPTTNRIAGDDRYETAVQLARALVTNSTNDNEVDGIIIASGENPYDALAAASLAGAKNAPVLLVKQNDVPESVVDFLTDEVDELNGDPVYIIGGTAAVSQAAADEIGALLEDSAIRRIAGDNRYLTAKAIAETAGVMDGSDTVILVNGDNDRWADALNATALAAAKKWPIIPTANGGLNDAAKAAIDVYLALPGSAKQFVIIGGPTVMPTSVDEYLVTKGVVPANIRRLGGVDRYQTNTLVQLYMALELPVVGFQGQRVALVSGVSPWDAIAASLWSSKTTTHIVLTSPTAINPSTGALATALSKLFFRPTDLFVVGGRRAVPQEIVVAARAAVAAAVDLGAPTLTGCTIGSTQVTMTLPSALNGAISPSILRVVNTEYTQWLTGTPNTYLRYFTLNGQKLSDVAGTSISLATPNPLKSPYKEITVKLAGALAAGDVFTFTGIEEQDEFTNTPRNYAGASCTVARDTTPPTATSVKAVATSSAVAAPFLGASNGHILVTFSEPVVGASLSAMSVTIGATSTTVAAYPMTADLRTYALVVSNSAAAPTISAGALVTIPKESVRDLAGNVAASNITAAAAAVDETAPTVTVAGSRCVYRTGATATAGNLTVTRADGAAGNAWKLFVTTSRGLLIPSIAVDASAKTITVAADVGYHTAQDVTTVARNMLLENAVLGAWTFSGSGALTATAATGVAFTGGLDDCALLVTSPEPIAIRTQSNNPFLTLTVDGFGQDTIELLPFPNPGALQEWIVIVESNKTGAGLLSGLKADKDVQDIMTNASDLVVNFNLAPAVDEDFNWTAPDT